MKGGTCSLGNQPTSPKPSDDTHEEEAKYIDAFDPWGHFLGIVQVVGEKTFPKYVVINDGNFWTQESNENGQVKMIRYRIEEAK
jgi:hypothetical protein